MIEIDGYLINHFREPGTVQDYHELPNLELNYKLIPAVLPSFVPLHYKFLKIGQLLVQEQFYSEQDIDQIVDLDPVYLLVLEKYDYGSIVNLLPEKQDKMIYLFCWENGITVLSNELFTHISNSLEGSGDKEEIARKRRELAVDYIVERALLIEQNEAILTSLRTQANDVNFTLQSSIKEFFQEFSLEMVQYTNSGSMAIGTNINEILNETSPVNFAWLQFSLPNIPTLGGFIRDVLGLAISNIDQSEIDLFWEMFNDNDFAIPTTEQVLTRWAELNA